MCIALYDRCLLSSAEESLFRFSPSKMCQTLRTKNNDLYTAASECDFIHSGLSGFHRIRNMYI